MDFLCLSLLFSFKIYLQAQLNTEQTGGEAVEQRPGRKKHTFVGVHDESFRGFRGPHGKEDSYFHKLMLDPHPKQPPAALLAPVPPEGVLVPRVHAFLPCSYQPHVFFSNVHGPLYAEITLPPRNMMSSTDMSPM